MSPPASSDAFPDDPIAVLILQARKQRDIPGLLRLLEHPEVEGPTRKAVSNRELILASLIEPSSIMDYERFNPARRIDPRAYAVLIEACSDRNWGVVRTAARSLGFAGDLAVAPSLEALLTSSDWATRLHAIEGLGRLRARSAMPALERSLTDPRYSIRKWASDALVVIRDHGALEPLRAAAAAERMLWRRRYMSANATALAVELGE